MKTNFLNNRAEWLVPTALIVLSSVPLVAGALRITELTGGAEVTQENARFFASPFPVMLHILSASLYTFLGAFQFVPGFRRQRPSWHRTVGRLLIPSGLIAAFSGLWMTLFYPWSDGDGVLLFGFRLLFGSVMVLSIIFGLTAIQRRDIVGHSAWMIRGYAIGLGAGTQFLTHLPWVIFFGAPDEFPKALLMGAGWVINLTVAEWIIRNRMTQPAGASQVAV
jgi:hypothetical protein